MTFLLIMDLRILKAQSSQLSAKLNQILNKNETYIQKIRLLKAYKTCSN
jgi:hypothetical protein